MASPKQEWPCWYYHPEKDAQLIADPAAAAALMREPGWAAAKIGGDPDAIATKLNPDGPTIEEYVGRGYKPENYPPEGFAEKPSAHLAFFKATKQWPSLPAPAPDVPPLPNAVPPTPGVGAQTNGDGATDNGAAANPGQPGGPVAVPAARARGRA